VITNINITSEWSYNLFLSDHAVVIISLPKNELGCVKRVIETPMRKELTSLIVEYLSKNWLWMTFPIFFNTCILTDINI